MAAKRRRGVPIPVPMFQTRADLDWAMEALGHDEARLTRHVGGEKVTEKTKPEPVLCGWCDFEADTGLGQVADEVFCPDHFRAAQREAALNGGVLVTVARRQKDAFGKAKSRALEAERT